MATNILIGVGGTGAKVVEATLHAAAAGLGPESLLVGFVDQDQSNGNVARAKQLLATLTEARAVWTKTGNPHRLGADADLLRTAIAPLAPGAEVWTPHAGQSVTLSRIFGRETMPEEDRHLFDILFATGELEQDMMLGEGYRGRPHLGAAAMASEIDGDTEFWKALFQHVMQAQGGAEVRLVLAGSVFGGTGAAGFPTLARLIRRRLQEYNLTRNVRIGGALMLPYFGFDAPEDDTGHEANVARTEQLLMQSREAVKYYHDLFAQEHVFDELYFVGWDPSFQLGYHSAGSGEQANPALLPEWLAALGVCRFLHPTHVIDESVTNPVYVCGRSASGVVDWADMPSPDVSRPNLPYEKFGQLLRFGVAWRFWQGVLGPRRGLIAKFLDKDAWYKAQGVDSVNFGASPPETEMRRLSDYIEMLLVWAASIQHYCREARVDFRLWRTDGVIDRVNKDQPNGQLVVLRSAFTEDSYSAAFGTMVVKHPTSDDLPTAMDLVKRLSETPLPGEFNGLGRVVAALHAYSATARH